MGLRVLFVTALALAVLGANQSRADEGAAGIHAKRRVHASHRSYRIYGRGVGGHLYGDQLTPYIYHTPYSNSPYFDNRTFWERVETQADYPVR